MKALQLQGIQKVAWVDVPVPPIRSSELLIRTGAFTICTSDQNDTRENPYGIAYPVPKGGQRARN